MIISNIINYCNLFRYFACHRQECVIFGVAVHDNDIYYTYQQNEVVILEMISFDGLNRKQINKNFPIK